jgi:hypothetical protein
MAYNNYSSYSASTLDAKDKHSDAELRKMDEAELKRQLKLAIDGNDNAYLNLVKQVLDETIENKANSINDFQSAEGANQTMKSKCEAIQNMPDTTPAEKDAKNSAIKDLFKNEMKNWTSKVDNIIDFAKSQKGEADRLKNLFEGAITKNVKLKESLPFGKRGRLKRIYHQVQKIKEKYPEDRGERVLFHLMSLTRKNYTGMLQRWRRNIRAGARRRKYSKDIDGNLAVIKEKIKPDPKDGVVGTLVKERLSHLIEEAKDHYFESQRKSIYG